MKKYLFSMIALMAMIGCEEIPSGGADGAIPNGNPLLKIESNLSAFTKATDVSFEDGDAVGVSILVPEWDDDKALYAHNVKYTCSVSGDMETSEPVYWYDDKDQRSFVLSYYPYSPDYDLFDEWIFTVNADQSNHQKYTASDLLFACQSAKPTSSAVKLTYNHMLSKMLVYVENKSDEQIADVFLSDVYGTVQVDVSTEGPAEYQVSGSKGIVKMCPAQDAEGKSVWAAVIVPQESSQPELVITTVSKKQYTYTLSSPVDFVSGTKNTATIVLDESSVSSTFTPEISDWLPGNDLNFGQEGEEYVPVVPSVEKKLYYATGYMDMDTETGAALLWSHDGAIDTLFSPESSRFGSASAVVRDREGRLIVGGFCEGSSNEWNAVTWIAGEGNSATIHDSSEESLIIDMDLSASGEVIQCRYGGEPEYYMIGDRKIEHPDGFTATSLFVSGEDIYFSGYTYDEEYNMEAAYVRNGELYMLQGGHHAYHMVVYKDHVYVAGTVECVKVPVDFDVNYDGKVDENDYYLGDAAVLWIDGQMQPLLPSYDKSSSVGGLFVDETGVYVAVTTKDADIYLWKDGALTDVTPGNDYTWVYVEDVYVLDGTVYFGGFKDTADMQQCGPAIWRFEPGMSSAECTLLRGNSSGERGRFYFG